MQKSNREWQYQKVEIKHFDLNGYGALRLFFSHTEDLILISIPEWNWSFLWNLSDNDTIEDDKRHKDELIKALSIPMFSKEAKDLTNKIENYLYNKN